MGTVGVFLDRDGTLNVERRYLFRYSDWEWIPGAINAIRRLNRAGVKVVVVSNQAGIARGYYSEADLEALHARVAQDLRRHHARIDAFYFCPHHPEHGERRSCPCRKPAPGMLLQAARDLQLDLPRSYLVGDKQSDIEAGLRAGVSALLVSTGYGAQQRQLVATEIPFVRDIGRAVDHILGAASTTSKADARSRAVDARELSVAHVPGERTSP